jgi:hypothetical protein
MAMMIVAAAAWPAVGQTGAGLMIKPFAEGESIELSSEVILINSTTVKGVGGGDLDIYDAQGRFRVAGEQGRNLTIGFDTTYLDITAPLAPGAGATTLHRLVDQSFAIGFNVGQISDWQLDAVAGIGHAGNSPYNDGQALYGMGDLIFSHKLDADSSVQLYLNYDGNRSVLPDLPLPGIAYHRRLSDELSYTAGLPRSAVTWTPAPDLRIAIDYTLPTTVNARADWSVHQEVGVFAAFVSRLEAFTATSDVANRRIFFEQYRAEAGVRWEPCPSFELEIAGGYAFDQEFSRGFDLTNDTVIATLTDEPYFKVRVGLDF